MSSLTLAIDGAAELARIDAAEAALWADYAKWLRGPFAERIADVMALTALSDLPPEVLATIPLQLIGD